MGVGEQFESAQNCLLAHGKACLIRLNFLAMPNFVSTPRSAFFDAVKLIAPVLLGALPFGLVVGIVSAENNLSELQTLIQSSAIFAGASQLLMLELLQKDVTIPIILLSAGLLNLRHVIYSASLAPSYKSLALRWKVVLSFVMVDQVYALAYKHINEQPDEQNLRWYHLGLGLPLLITWVLGSMVGFAAGRVVPESWGLNFIIPLMFLGILVPTIKNYAYLTAAIVSATVALLSYGLPNNLGLIVATICGLLTGVLLDRKA